MTTRHLEHAEVLPAPAETVFALLHTPSAIRVWWQASRAIVIAEPGGLWVAAWGDEDRPDHVTAATIREFEPPQRMRLTDYRYAVRDGDLPFRADFVTEFSVGPAPGGTLLQVRQDGFPAATTADEFYRSCEIGWRETFAGIRRYLGATPS